MGFVEGRIEGEKEFKGKVFPKTLMPCSTCDLVELVKRGRAWLSDALEQHGAILFRGFGLGSAGEFASVVEAFGWEDFGYEGAADRNLVVERVYTASEAPLHVFINFHHEMALVKDFASKIFFFCLEPPREGGQTAIIRSDVIVEKMEEKVPQVVEELMREGIRFTLHTKAPYNNNSASNLNVDYVWQRMLRTKDKVEGKKRALETMACNSVSINDDGSADFVYGPMIPIRELNGKKVWFNTLMSYNREERDGCTTHGDGSPLPCEAIHAYQDILEENCVDINWQKGDLLLVDNLAVQHARRTGKPPRSILLSLCK